MEYNEQKQERVILAGVHRGMRDALWDTTEESIHELGELVKTAGGIVVGEMIQNKASPADGIVCGRRGDSVQEKGKGLTG